jgi:predicted tellurium resistance membrane protein TerC
MFEIFSIENLLAFLTLTGLEIVLGIDNIVFIAITTDKLPKQQKPLARRLGLGLAMFERIVLLCFVSWLTQLTAPLFSVMGKVFSGRDLILLAGGAFLIAKATLEIHEQSEADRERESPGGHKKKVHTLWAAMLQIVLLDTVFSLDSVITAVGMANHLPIMIGAIVIAVLVMMIFANPLSEFILVHPTVKTLALSFLLLVGVFLIAEGFGQHIDKGYIYFAIGFSVMVEALNFRTTKR